MDISKFSLNPDAERGVWFDVTNPADGEPLPGVRIKVASAESAEYQKAVQRYLERSRSAKRGRTPSMEEQREAALKAAVDVLLVDWEGIEYHGERLECTASNRERLLRAERWLYQQVIEAAQERERYAADALGNSASSPSGPSPEPPASETPPTE